MSSNRLYGIGTSVELKIKFDILLSKMSPKASTTELEEAAKQYLVVYSGEYVSLCAGIEEARKHITAYCHRQDDVNFWGGRLIDLQYKLDDLIGGYISKNEERLSNEIRIRKVNELYESYTTGFLGGAINDN